MNGIDYVECTCGHDYDGHNADGCFPACGCTDPSPEVLRVVEQVGAEQDALAEAWQAGYLRGTLDNESDLEPADNPYRETSR